MSDLLNPNRVSNFQDVIIFVEVGRRENFTHASQALGLPVSTIARRIAALEAELGLSLVERSTRLQRLTVDGRRCFERCRGVVDDALAACDDVRAEAHGLKGRIRLALPGDAATGVLTGIVASFLRDNDGIEIAVQAAHGGHQLGHDLDLLVCLGPPAGDAVVARRIGSVALRLYASPRYLAEHGAPRSRECLQAHEILIADSCADALADLRSLCSPAKLNRGGRLTVGDFAMVAALAVAGHGIALLPPDVAGPHALCGSLAPVLGDWVPSPLPVFVAMASRLMPARLRGFVAYLVERFAADAGRAAGAESRDGSGLPWPIPAAFGPIHSAAPAE